MIVAAFALLLLAALVLALVADARDCPRTATWAFVVLALACLLAVAMPAPAAPAPPARPAPPPPAIVPASVVMTWRGVDAETHFHAGGSFACHWQGRWWHGTWSQAGGVLNVTEWPAGEPGHVMRWGVTLRCPASGDMRGTPWRTRPLAGKIH